MKRFLTILLCGLTVLGVAAGNRPVSKMQELAAQKIASLGTNCAKTRSVGLERVLLQSELAVFSDGNHFAVISRDDRFPAVLAYGMGDFKADELNPAVQWWLEATERGLAAGKRSARSFQRTATYQPVAELMTTKWNQWAPYNNHAPALKIYGGEKAPAGCLAIAMAQVMNYFRYPASAQFVGYYYQEGVSNEAYQGNVNSTYSWPYLDYYNYYFPEDSTNYVKVNTSPRQGNLVATLCRDCAYAIDMQYTHDGSGAMVYVVAQKMIDHFSYPENGCHFYNRELYSSDEWHAIVYGELTKGNPIIYGGVDPNGHGGHAFVADGIDAEGLVHVNWGWAGKSNGFFDMDLMNCDETDQFSEEQGVVAYHPEALEGEVYGSLIGMEEPLALEYDKEKKTLTLTWGTYYNCCGKIIEGTVGFVLEHLTQPENSHILPLIDDDDEYTFLPYNGFYGNSAPIELEDGDLAPGDYHFYMASKDKHETEFQMARVFGIGLYYIEFSVDENGDIIVGEAVMPSGDTAIQKVTLSDASRQQKGIYDLRGHSLGTDANVLRKGLYIMNGKKVMK